MYYSCKFKVNIKVYKAPASRNVGAFVQSPDTNWLKIENLPQTCRYRQK